MKLDERIQAKDMEGKFGIVAVQSIEAIGIYRRKNKLLIQTQNIVFNEQNEHKKKRPEASFFTYEK